MGVLSSRRVAGLDEKAPEQRRRVDDLSADPLRRFSVETGP